MQGIRVIKALSKSNYEHRRYDMVNRALVKDETRAGVIMGGVNPVMTMFMNAGSVAVIALVLADKKKAVVLKVGKSKMSLTDGSFKAYPFCIAAGIVLAGMILSFFIGGAAFYSLIVLFAYYLVFTIVNTIKMM